MAHVLLSNSPVAAATKKGSMLIGRSMGLTWAELFCRVACTWPITSGSRGGCCITVDIPLLCLAHRSGFGASRPAGPSPDGAGCKPEKPSSRAVLGLRTANRATAAHTDGWYVRSHVSSLLDDSDKKLLDDSEALLDGACQSSEYLPAT